MRLYRENIALKAQLEALERHLVRVEATRKRSLKVRATQVFAHLLTRGDEPFQCDFPFLSALHSKNAPGPSFESKPPQPAACTLSSARRSMARLHSAIARSTKSACA